MSNEIIKKLDNVTINDIEVQTDITILVNNDSNPVEVIEDTISDIFSKPTNYIIVRYLSGPDYDDKYYDDYDENDFESISDTDGIYTVDLVIFNNVKNHMKGRIDLIGFNDFM